jgi:hypothetical protein
MAKKSVEEKRVAQAAAHRKWRQSEKGKAYYLKRKVAEYTAKESGMMNGQIPDARGHAFTEGCGCGACQQDQAERLANA